MGYQAVFNRYELKYKITGAQKAKIMKAMEPYMEADRYGKSTIRNIYFDTDDFILARHSIAKPDFKEKLRVRSYSKADADSTVFVELKRKYDHVVYKRRVGVTEREAVDWICRGKSVGMHEDQRSREIDYFLSLYDGIRPVLYLSYDREAYRMRDGSDFRVTFDTNILCREDDLSLESDPYGTSIIEDGMFLMELKCSGGIPVWMTRILSKERIYKTSFSKYGTAYCRFMDETPAERAHGIASESLVAAFRERKVSKALPSYGMAFG
ncbi:MAG: polyphosphate polymerase domain-containing protein [Mogibacterium sp.]|nr:polyphosphate polymerase domain-containing protein [Mogibacterium sp.]